MSTKKVMFLFNHLKFIVLFISFSALHHHRTARWLLHPPKIFREMRTVLLSTEEAHKAMLSDTRTILVHKEFTQ